MFGDDVSTYYGPSQTYGAVFGSMASSMEECRAETSSLFLSPLPNVQETFGFEGQQRLDSLRAGWLGMAKMGLDSLAVCCPSAATWVTRLQAWDPDTASWGQPHCAARFTLLRWLLKAGGGSELDEWEAGTIAGGPLLKIRAVDDSVGATCPELILDSSLLETVGVEALREPLMTMTVLRATADVARGQPWWSQQSTLTPAWERVRDDVLQRRRPRSVFVQDVFEERPDGRVDVISFPSTVAGLISSMLRRFRS